MFPGAVFSQSDMDKMVEVFNTLFSGIVGLFQSIQFWGFSLFTVLIVFAIINILITFFYKGGGQS